MSCDEAGCSTVQGRCIPIGNIDAKLLVNTVVSGGLQLLLGIIASFTDDEKYYEVPLQCDREINRCFHGHVFDGTSICTLYF
jgi:hypothetical protein